MQPPPDAAGFDARVRAVLNAFDQLIAEREAEGHAVPPLHRAVVLRAVAEKHLHGDDLATFERLMLEPFEAVAEDVEIADAATVFLNNAAAADPDFAGALAYATINGWMDEYGLPDPLRGTWGIMAAQAQRWAAPFPETGHPAGRADDAERHGVAVFQSKGRAALADAAHAADAAALDAAPDKARALRFVTLATGDDGAPDDDAPADVRAFIEDCRRRVLFAASRVARCVGNIEARRDGLRRALRLADAGLLGGAPPASMPTATGGAAAPTLDGVATAPDAPTPALAAYLVGVVAVAKIGREYPEWMAYARAVVAHAPGKTGNTPQAVGNALRDSGLPYGAKRYPDYLPALEAEAARRLALLASEDVPR